MLRVPAAVDRLLRKLLQKDPADRYQTPVELAAELQSILQKLADGALEREALESTAEMPPLPPAAPAARPKARPIIHLTPVSRPLSGGSLAVLSAVLGGLACIVCVTVIAVILSAGSSTRANTKNDDDARPKINAPAPENREP